MAILYIYCGIPGSGKSYYASQHKLPNTEYLSRDEIRFSMVKEDEEYFSKETAVFNEFSRRAAECIANGKNVICDATHVSRGSRRKLISTIDTYLTEEQKDYSIVYVVFNTPFEVCCERNAAREGRARVPDNVMERFRDGWNAPRMNEDERVMGRKWVGGRK